MQNSNQIHDSLHALDTLIHIVDQITHSLEGSMNSLIEHSEIVCKIAGGSGIAISQRELRYGHVTMNVNLMEGIAILDSAYKNLGCEVDTLRNKAIEIEKEMSKFEQSEALEDVRDHLVENSMSILAMFFHRINGILIGLFFVTGDF